MRRFLLLAFCLLSCSASFAADYTWRIGTGHSIYLTPAAACDALVASNSVYRFVSLTKVSDSQFNCGIRHYAESIVNHSPLYRSGDSCPTGSTYNPTTGNCDDDPTCPAAGTNKLVAFTCDCSGKYCTNPSSFSFEGCGYEKNLVITDINYSTTIKNYADPASSTCMGVATSTGQPLAPSDGVEELCADCIAEVPKETDEQPSCVTVNVHEFCPDPAHPGCGQRDGQAYCFNETDACGVFGAGEGVAMCIPSSGGRTCSYAKGEYTCVDKATGEVISSTSSDHPSNGGNGDGNDTNDAQAPGAVVTAGGGSPQGSDEGATNKAITDLQGALTDRLDGISDLLGEGEPTAKNINAPTETGSLDLDEWDEKIEQAKAELKQSSEGIGDLMNAANNWIITGSGGSLSCFVEDWGRMCLADYQDQLVGIRYVLIFMASILAIYIIFIRD